MDAPTISPSENPAGSMGVDAEPTGSAAQRSNRGVVLYAVGCGLFLLGCYGSLPVVSYLGSPSYGWELVLVVRAVFFATSIVGCFAVRRFLGAWSRSRVRFANGAVALALVGCYGGTRACAVFGAPAWVLVVLGALWGAAAAYPLLFWARALLFVYRVNGRRLCLVAATGSILVATALNLALYAADDNQRVLLGLFCALAVGHWFCQERIVFWGGIGVPTPSCMMDWRLGSYRLTRHSFVVIACVGFIMGLLNACLIFLASPSQSNAQTWLAAVVPAAVWGGLLWVCLRCSRGVAFGLIMRLLITADILLFAWLPLTADWPAALRTIMCVVYSMQGGLLPLFAVEAAAQVGLSVVVVHAKHYVLYAWAACVGILVFALLQRFVPPAMLWPWVAAAGAAVSAATVPLLPSISSGAIAFTLKVLPENESRDQRVAQVCERLASSCGLTARETDVLRLLARGMGRQEIAAKLSLSALTARDLMSRVYRKVGVGSHQELMSRVFCDAEAGG